jgi:hypothetical protein
MLPYHSAGLVRACFAFAFAYVGLRASDVVAVWQLAVLVLVPGVILSFLFDVVLTFVFEYSGGGFLACYLCYVHFFVSQAWFVVHLAH